MFITIIVKKLWIKIQHLNILSIVTQDFEWIKADPETSEDLMNNFLFENNFVFNPMAGWARKRMTEWAPLI